VEYRKVGSLYWTWAVDKATSPLTITHPGGAGNQFEWQVTAFCSPSNYSATGGDNFTLPRCIGQLVECSCLPTGKFPDDNGNSAFTIFPNPTDGILNITFETSSKEDVPVIIELFDLTGRTVFAITETISLGQLEKEISVSDLPTGFYIVNLTMMGKEFQQKVVLE
jgi:hypothetical protein